MMGNWGMLETFYKENPGKLKAIKDVYNFNEVCNYAFG